MLIATTTGKCNGPSLKAASDYDLKTRRLFVTDKKKNSVSWLTLELIFVFTQKNLFEVNNVNQTMNFLLLMEQSLKHMALKY